MALIAYNQVQDDSSEPKGKWGNLDKGWQIFHLEKSLLRIVLFKKKTIADTATNLLIFILLILL